MPLYEYRCKNCSAIHEIEHGFNDERPTKCPLCGGELIRVFHPVGVVFKGSGFHKTDYTRGSRPGSGAKEKSGEGKPTEGKAPEAKSAEPSKTTESKPKESAK